MSLNVGIIFAAPTNCAVVMHRVTRFILFPVLCVGLFGACGESPESVCEHTMGLMKAAGAPAFDREECVADMAKTKEKRNFLQWMRFSNCVEDLETMDGMKNCTGLLGR